MAPLNLSHPLTETEARDEAWNRRFIGILNGTLPPFTDEEIIEEVERRYEDLQSGKSRGLTWEEHRLFDQLADEFPHLSDQAIFEEIDRRYEKRQGRKTRFSREKNMNSQCNENRHRQAILRRETKASTRL